MKTFGIIAFLALSSLSARNALAREKSASPVLTAPGGRFVLGQISEFPADQYLLDTQTGRVWRIVRDTGDKTETLQPLLFLAADGTKTSTIEEADKAKTK